MNVSNEATEQATTAKVVQAPTEGKLFEVNPLVINRSSFEKPMRDRWQEWTRQIIQQAFAKVDKHPEKYALPFYTLIPEKNWNSYKTVAELKAYANDLGGHMADWVEQALEWAQRICNGESWEAVCNNTDTANWNRMILWKDGYYRLVGGSRDFHDLYPASYVGKTGFRFYDKVRSTGPLTVIRF